MINSKIFKIFLVLFLTLFFTGCGDSGQTIKSGKTIKIGILAPLTGDSVRLGHQSIIGIEAANKIKKYLKNGDEIVFEIIDTKSNIQSAKYAFKQLVKSDVKVIFSFMGSTEMVALKSSFNKAKIPIISTLATNNNITSRNGYVAQVCIDNYTQVLVASHYIKDEKFIDNIGVVYDKRSVYSNSLAREFKKEYSFIGGKVDFFIDISDDNGLEEFKKFDKKNIKILFNATDAELTTKIINMQNNKFEILGADGLYSGALELDKTSLFKGISVIEHYAHNVDKSKDRKRFEKLLNKENFKESSFAFLAYDGYSLLTYALEHCESYEKKCINKVLHNSKIITGIAGNFSMINAKAKREVYIDKIEDSILKKEIIIY